ncbi:TonB-dependent receptor plug domain-containing protein, partial [Achromobacter sp.]
MQDPRPVGLHLSRRPRATLRRATSLVLMALASGAVLAQESGVATLPAVQVQADGDPTTTEGTGSYTPRATSASTGLPLSLRETPQSVTVVTRQRIEDQDMRSITDILGNTPGISVQNYDSERYTFSSRGFAISNYLYDGVPTSFDIGYAGGESSLDSIIYDRVEVVRGATGLLTGAGNPSASVNLVRKHATSREFKADLSVSAGTSDAYRASADLSSPLNASGSVRGRIVSAYQDNHSYLDGYQNRKKVFY